MTWLFRLANLSYLLPTLFIIAMVIDFVRRRPDIYWLFIILFFGPLGSLIYFVVIVVPGIPWLPTVYRSSTETRRINEIKGQLVYNPSPHLLTEIGELYFRRRRNHTALDYLRRALEADPKQLTALYFTAQILARQRLNEQAAAALERLLTFNDDFDYGAAPLLLARLYLKQDRFDDAKCLVERVLSRHAFLEARYYLGLILQHEGDSNAAQKQFQRVIDEGRALPSYKLKTERKWIRRSRKAAVTNVILRK